MQSTTTLCWVILAVYALPAKTNIAVQLALNSITNNTEITVTSLEEALSLMSNLTDAQKQVWDQQKAHEKDIKLKNKVEEEREAARTRALEQEQLLLKDLRGKIQRKLKLITKNTNNGNGCVPSNVNRPKDCASIFLDGDDVSGVYRVWPTWNKDEQGFLVYCDMETDGGGWTVIHRWGNFNYPADFFDRSWAEYKTGFGDLETAFWLGNEQIWSLTRQGVYDLRFDLGMDKESQLHQETALYHGFWIGEESKSYAIHVGTYNTTVNRNAGDVLSYYNEKAFETPDQRRTRDSYGRSCSETLRRGWWKVDTCDFLKQVVSTSFTNDMKIRPSTFQQMKFML